MTMKQYAVPIVSDCIDFSKLRFKARPDTWFDEGSFVDIDPTTVLSHDVTGAVFTGLVDGNPDEEYCSIFEFDWIDESGDCLNSNIPHMTQTAIHGNWVVMDFETKNKYNFLLNQQITKD